MLFFITFIIAHALLFALIVNFVKSENIKEWEKIHSCNDIQYVGHVDEVCAVFHSGEHDMVWLTDCFYGGMTSYKGLDFKNRSSSWSISNGIISWGVFAGIPYTSKVGMVKPMFFQIKAYLGNLKVKRMVVGEMRLTENDMIDLLEKRQKIATRKRKIASINC
jgi:hypothetical protein